MDVQRSLSSVIGLMPVVLFVIACGTPSPPTGLFLGRPPSPPTPSIIEHPQPTLTVDAMMVYKDWESGDRCLRDEGGMFRMCARARVYLDGAFREISTQEELRELFAPIESPEEALSYALLATGYSAKYDPSAYRLSGPCDPGQDPVGIATLSIRWKTRM